MIDINNYKKDRTVCKTCYNKSKRKNNNIILTPNDLKTRSNKTVKKKNKLKAGSNIENVDNDNNDIVSAYESRANVFIGPRNVGKTYYMLKVLEKIGNKRLIHITTRSPNQYSSYKTSDEIKPINKYKGSVVIFDDMLGAKNSSQIDEFLQEADMKIWKFIILVRVNLLYQDKVLEITVID